MRGVKEVVSRAFGGCVALTHIECGKLEIIGFGAFGYCHALRSIDLPSIKIVKWGALSNCASLTNVKFGKDLESIGQGVFYNCFSLQRITLPLKDGMITDDNIFQLCPELKHIDLVEGTILDETIAALLLEEWKDGMNEEIDSINRILPNTPAGDRWAKPGGKAQAIRTWIRSVLRKIIYYKAEHRRCVSEAATTLQPALPNDILLKNVIPFLELPSYTFQGEN